MRAVAGFAATCLLSVILVSPSHANCDAHSAAALAGPDDVVPHELVVTFKNGVPPERAREISGALGVAVLRTMLGGRIQHVRATEGTSVDQLRQAYLSHPEVTAAEPNYKIRARSAQ